MVDVRGKNAKSEQIAFKKYKNEIKFFSKPESESEKNLNSFNEWGIRNAPAEGKKYIEM